MFHGLLVSSGFSNPMLREKAGGIAKRRRYTQARIVTTARPEKENAPWNKITKEQLEEMGMTVAFVDFDAGECIDGDTDLIYVCGGNTFHLLYSIQTSGKPIRRQIEDMCDRGGLYIGSSAGAVLVGPDIASAGDIHPDKNTDGITDLAGLNFIPQHIIPHYDPAMDDEITAFCEKHAVPTEEIVLLHDGDGLYVDAGKQEKIRADR